MKFVGHLFCLRGAVIVIYSFKKSTVMKKILSIITLTAAITFIMAACNRNPVTTQTVPGADTAGFAQFKTWKAMNVVQAPCWEQLSIKRTVFSPE